ncbi:hypothetical protein BpHYR1_039395 [Brachionus plicatilis]|uniref:Uncharacterized protein n=1 Tax=Brachionus plicatilis TaxID=10195 RepID=A0A3M7SUU6_BRAPC|nr:hypothetical protein BpHYR1_039395 [Brachionus plicatilis]
MHKYLIILNELKSNLQLMLYWKRFGYSMFTKLVSSDFKHFFKLSGTISSLEFVSCINFCLSRSTIRISEQFLYLMSSFLQLRIRPIIIDPKTLMTKSKGKLKRVYKLICSKRLSMLRFKKLRGSGKQNSGIAGFISVKWSGKRQNMLGFVLFIKSLESMTPCSTGCFSFILPLASFSSSFLSFILRPSNFLKENFSNPNS